MANRCCLQFLGSRVSSSVPHIHTKHKKEDSFIYCTDNKDFNSNHARREEPLFNRHKERCI